MFKIKTSLIILLFLFVSSIHAKSNPIIVISIDGLRYDAIKIARATNLLKLMETGNNFTKSSTIDLSITLPSHTSMFTGLDYTEHGITWNEYKPENGVVKFPTFLELAKNNGSKTAMFITEGKLGHLLRPNSVDYFEQTDNKAHLVSTAFKNYLKTNDLPDVTFIHLPDPDREGHKFGWLSPFYLKAVKDADKAVDIIIKLAREKNKNVISIISADHGGTFFEHLLPIETNRHTPMIVNGYNIKENQNIETPVKIYDIAATVLKLLSIELPENFTGKPLPLSLIGEEELAKSTKTNNKTILDKPVLTH